MVARCTKPKDQNYPQYGGRGITVSDRWLKFENFMEDMGPRPPNPPNYKRYYTLERLDNDGGYSKENCVWAGWGQQQNNRRSNHLLTYKGREQTITNWAKEVGISKVTLQWRIAEGWPLEKAFSPARPKRPNGTA